MPISQSIANSSLRVRTSKWWVLAFGPLVLGAVAAGFFADTPGAVGISLAILGISVSVAVMFAKGVTFASVLTFSIAIYAICVRIEAMNDSMGYFVAIGLCAALTVVALINTTPATPPPAPRAAPRRWVATAFVVLLFAAIGVALFYPTS